MDSTKELKYYSKEFFRKTGHYIDKKINGYQNHGDLKTAAHTILNKENGKYNAGSHFRGIWPRDICFSAQGIKSNGDREKLAEISSEFTERIENVFYTDFHEEFAVAAPREGVDTFPAIVVAMDEAGILTEYHEELKKLAELHRDKFYNEENNIVDGNGSSWWDSAKHPRETYNTAMLLAALERLQQADIDTTYTDKKQEITRGIIDCFWNGKYFDENRYSSVLASDANVVPLYFGLLDKDKAHSIVNSLSRLETKHGIHMREKPFTLGEVDSVFFLHRDYHYPIWPWNNFMYTNGLKRYGFTEKAEKEMNRVESLLKRYGNFLEVMTLEGEPYMKRGFASAEGFTVAAALWLEYHEDQKQHQ